MVYCGLVSPHRSAGGDQVTLTAPRVVSGSNDTVHGAVAREPHISNSSVQCHCIYKLEASMECGSQAIFADSAILYKQQSCTTTKGMHACKLYQLYTVTRVKMHDTEQSNVSQSAWDPLHASDALP